MPGTHDTHTRISNEPVKNETKKGIHVKTSGPLLWTKIYRDTVMPSAFFALCHGDKEQRMIMHLWYFFSKQRYITVNTDGDKEQRMIMHLWFFFSKQRYITVNTDCDNEQRTIKHQTRILLITGGEKMTSSIASLSNEYRRKHRPWQRAKSNKASEAHSADNTVKKGEKKQRFQIKTSLNAGTHTLDFPGHEKKHEEAPWVQSNEQTACLLASCSAAIHNFRLVRKVKKISHTTSSAQFFSNTFLLSDTWPCPPKISPFKKETRIRASQKKNLQSFNHEEDPQKNNITKSQKRIQ
jgi:hypothetical protein